MQLKIDIKLKSPEILLNYFFALNNNKEIKFKLLNTILNSNKCLEQLMNHSSFYSLNSFANSLIPFAFISKTRPDLHLGFK